MRTYKRRMIIERSIKRLNGTMSSFLKIIFSLILIYNLIYMAISTKHNIIRGQKLLCGTYDPHLVNISCRFRRVNRTTEFWAYDGFYAPLYNITSNLHINLTVYAKQQNLEWRPHMIVNYIINVCKYMDGSLANKVFDILLNDLKRSSNFMRPCPGPNHFYVRNMTFNDDNFPPIIPPGELYLDFRYHTYINGEMRKLYYLRPYLEIKTKGIFYFK